MSNTVWLVIALLAFFGGLAAYTVSLIARERSARRRADELRGTHPDVH